MEKLCWADTNWWFMLDWGGISETKNSTFTRTAVRTHYVEREQCWFQSELNSVRNGHWYQQRRVHRVLCLCIHYFSVPLKALFWETVNESPDVRAHFPLREMKWRAAHLVSCVHSSSLTDSIQVCWDVMKLSYRNRMTSCIKLHKEIWSLQQIWNLKW